MYAKYLTSLFIKSARIQRVIEDEQNRKAPDRMKLLKLKKVRLVIKDKIHRLLKGKTWQSA